MSLPDSQPRAASEEVGGGGAGTTPPAPAPSPTASRSRFLHHQNPPTGGSENPGVIDLGRIEAAAVVVFRSEGPKGYPGMRQMLAVIGDEGAGRGGD
ncbi:MAG: hypothetical protein ACRDZ8_04590 [Acidimicrobiales bacterium]